MGGVPPVVPVEDLGLLDEVGGSELGGVELREGTLRIADATLMRPWASQPPTGMLLLSMAARTFVLVAESSILLNSRPARPATKGVAMDVPLLEP